MHSRSHVVWEVNLISTLNSFSPAVKPGVAIVVLLPLEGGLETGSESPQELLVWEVKAANA